jgi:hypothetical protein
LTNTSTTILVGSSGHAGLGFLQEHDKALPYPSLKLSAAAPMTTSAAARTTGRDGGERSAEPEDRSADQHQPKPRHFAIRPRSAPDCE